MRGNRLTKFLRQYITDNVNKGLYTVLSLILSNSMAFRVLEVRNNTD